MGHSRHTPLPSMEVAAKWVKCKGTYNLTCTHMGSVHNFTKYSNRSFKCNNCKYDTSSVTLDISVDYGGEKTCLTKIINNRGTKWQGKRHNSNVGRQLGKLQASVDSLPQVLWIINLKNWQWAGWHQNEDRLSWTRHYQKYK